MAASSGRPSGACSDAGIDALPVFHQGEPWSVLRELAERGRIGVGFQRPIRSADEFLTGLRDHRFVGSRARLRDGERAVHWTLPVPRPSTRPRGCIELKALSAITGQASDVLQYLTQGELLKLVVLKYRRMPMATAWAGRKQGGLFHDLDGAA